MLPILREGTLKKEWIKLLEKPLFRIFLPWIVITMFLAGASSFLFRIIQPNAPDNFSFSRFWPVAIDISIALVSSFSLYFTNGTRGAPIEWGFIYCCSFVPLVLMFFVYKITPYTILTIMIILHAISYRLTHPELFPEDNKFRKDRAGEEDAILTSMNNPEKQAEPFEGVKLI